VSKVEPLAGSENPGKTKGLLLVHLKVNTPEPLLQKEIEIVNRRVSKPLWLAGQGIKPWLRDMRIE